MIYDMYYVTLFTYMHVIYLTLTKIWSSQNFIVYELCSRKEDIFFHFYPIFYFQFITNIHLSCYGYIYIYMYFLKYIYVFIYIYM